MEKSREERRSEVRGIYRSLLERDKSDLADLVAKVAKTLDPKFSLTPATAGKTADNSAFTDEDEAMYQHFLANSGAEK